MATPTDLLIALARAYAFTETRFSGDPEYAEAIEKVRDLQEEVGWVPIRVEAQGVSARGQLIQEEPDPEDFRAPEEVVTGEEGGPGVGEVQGEVEKLRSAMEEAGIREIRLQEVPEAETLEEFLRRLHPVSAREGLSPSARFRGLEEEIGLTFSTSRGELPGMAGGIQSLFHRPDPPTPGQEEPSAFPTVASVAPGEYASPSVGLSPELKEEVRTYLESYDLLRKESEQRLRKGAAKLAGSRNVPALSELVELLTDSGGFEAGDEEAMALARDITTPAVASHLVARLGAARYENERRRLARILSRIGREGALALGDALVEARDRSERRAFLDAMVTLGPFAREMAEKMVQDPRWFVVRNGVALLGALGGQEALSHLTATLANGDARVRKETVMSLAKVGGRDAERLLLGMLGDGDAEVRAMTCRALGVLKTHEACEALLSLLKDRDQDVQLECVRALGQIGDPTAVPLLEKKAKGGLFSRPPQPVRIAAYRALASLGTARALKALERGRKERDPAVRRVVQTLLGES